MKSAEPGPCCLRRMISGSKHSISSIRKCLLSTTWGSCSRSNSNPLHLKRMGFWHSSGTGRPGNVRGNPPVPPISPVGRHAELLLPRRCPSALAGNDPLCCALHNGSLLVSAEALPEFPIQERESDGRCRENAGVRTRAQQAPLWRPQSDRESHADKSRTSRVGGSRIWAWPLTTPRNYVIL